MVTNVVVGRDDGTRRLAPSEIGQAASLLARGFQDDPLFAYLLPDPDRRARLAPGLLGSLVRYGVRYGVVESTTEGIDGGAVWLPPGGTTMSPGRMLRTGVMAAPLGLGAAGLVRFAAFIKTTEDAHAQAVAGPHWYLNLLAVEPTRQGRGLGGRLLRPGLARADQARVPAYLETHNPDNVRFYRRHGFEVVVEETVPRGGLVFWGMRRDPVV